MDSTRVSIDRAPTPEAVEFVRFCYRRRRVGWPELYDEMCAVAGRGLFKGWGSEELAGIGIGFALFEMPALAALVARVVAEDAERRLRALAAAEKRSMATLDAAEGARVDLGTGVADDPETPVVVEDGALAAVPSMVVAGA